MLFLLPWLLGIERFQADFILPHRPYQNPGFYHLWPNLDDFGPAASSTKNVRFWLNFFLRLGTSLWRSQNFSNRIEQRFGLFMVFSFYGNVQHFGFLNSPTFYFLQRYIGNTYVLHIFRIRYIHAYQNLLRAIFKNELLVALFEYFWISCKNCVTWIILSLLCMEKKRSKLSTTLEWLESRMSPECQPNTSDTDPELWRRNLTFNEEY